MLIEAISYGKNKDILRANIKKVTTEMDNFINTIINKNNIYSQKVSIINENTELEDELIVEYNVIV